MHNSPYGRATYRQVDYWASRGAFGEEHVAVGSGRAHNWTEWEQWKFDVIGGVAQNLSGVATNILTSTVKALWTALDDPECSQLQYGSVIITLPAAADRPWPSGQIPLHSR